MFVTPRDWSKMTPDETWSVLKLSSALRSSWSSDTTYPDDAGAWTARTPSLGQCAVTSLVVQEVLGGTIHRNGRHHHYWNQLPSDALVDFTHEQFGITEPIPSDGLVSRRDLLVGEKAGQALTESRYKILRTRVKHVSRKLVPTLFLISSNAQAEYLRDIIEVMGTPAGMIHHFRYKLKYLSPAVRNLLLLRDHAGKNHLSNIRVVVLYLRQEQDSSGEYRWIGLLPIRAGRLRECYRTGDSENATAHFHFEVDESLRLINADPQPLKELFGDQYGKAFAFVSFETTSHLYSSARPSDVFEEQCEALKKIGLTHAKTGQNGTIEYAPPLILLVEGIYRERSRKWPSRLAHLILDKLLNRRPRPLSLSFNRGGMKSYYRFSEGRLYHLRIRTYNWEHRMPHEIVATMAKELFATPDQYVLSVNSAYDGECWDLIPAYVKQNTCGLLRVSTRVKANEDDGNIGARLPLHEELQLPYELRRRNSLVFIDTFCDLLFAAGPAYLALTKVLETKTPTPWYLQQWPYVLFGIYGLWFVFRLGRRVMVST